MLSVVCKGSFDDYLASLSEKSLQQFDYVEKHNKKTFYWESDLTHVEKFMQIWARQLVRGHSIEWGFPYSTVEGWWEEKKLKVFIAKAGTEVIACHFIQARDGFWECHPPMYEKNKPNMHRYLGKFMWFRLIEFAHRNNLGVLDLGGGPARLREHLARRDEFPNPRYKDIYIPEQWKRNPNSAPDYEIIEQYGERSLITH